MADSTRGVILPRLFWAASGIGMAALVVMFTSTVLQPHGQFAGLLALLLLAMIVLLGAVMAAVALIRRPAAYWVGLALVAWPPAYYAMQYLTELAQTPGAAALAAGHGFFDGAAEGALADAIVAGDAAKVAALAPAARLDAVGWEGMTFMRLALDQGHAVPEVVVALLKAGADPDQDNRYLFGSFTDGEAAGSGAMITGHNERLLRAVIAAGVDVNRPDREGYPRFFSALRWPEGLAILLENGAAVEAEGADGNTALMWAVSFRQWDAAAVLLAHGAGAEHVARNGRSLRDIVSEAGKRQRMEGGDLPAALARLEDQLR